MPIRQKTLAFVSQRFHQVDAENIDTNPTEFASVALGLLHDAGFTRSATARFHRDKLGGVGAIRTLARNSRFGRPFGFWNSLNGYFASSLSLPL